MKLTSETSERNDAGDRRELAHRIGITVCEDGVAEPIPGLFLTRSSRPTERVHGVSKPCFCVIAQGRKEVFLGSSRYCYDAEHYLLATVELPISGRVIEASNEHPYLALRLEL